MNEDQVKKGEIVPISPINDSALVTEADVLQAEEGAKRIGRIIMASIGCTNRSDWMSIDDKPYPKEGAIHKICALWGVELGESEIVEEHRKDPKGEWIIYTCTGSATRKNRTAHFIGTAHTRLPIYGNRSEWVDVEKDGKKSREKVKKMVPLEDVDLPNVKKHAWTNWAHNAVTKLLGLRNVEWSDLERALGADAVKWIMENADVSHKSKEQDKTASDSPQVADKRKSILRSLLILVSGEPEKMPALLKARTTWTAGDGKEVAGKDSIKALTEKQVERYEPIFRGEAEAALKKIPDETRATFIKHVDEFVTGAK